MSPKNFVVLFLATLCTFKIVEAGCCGGCRQYGFAFDDGEDLCSPQVKSCPMVVRPQELPKPAAFPQIAKPCPCSCTRAVVQPAYVYVVPPPAPTCKCTCKCTCGCGSYY
ncbi:small proline-rich protein 2I-like [Aethina tumida]|uniref:small proline-rich protein 2I-like n=1 Tax=Aethina tumida TaxID=116153 RepID=UPI0021490827|nr:small proline-rich protein 2I-like [Aethina tumida]